MPKLTINLSKIRSNAAALVKMCAAAGVRVTGVTKGVLGAPLVAKAMYDGGIRSLADSHPECLSCLREALPDVKLGMLRQPMWEQLRQVVGVADYSLVSDVRIVGDLEAAAESLGKKHGVLLVLELGSLREGLPVERLDEVVGRVESSPWLTLEGLGVYRSVKKGAPDDSSMMQRLADLGKKASSRVGRALVISGGNSSGLGFLSGGPLWGINDLRLGEAILFGHETARYTPLPGLATGAFRVSAEVIEVKTVGGGSYGAAAAGASRAILAVGREDLAREPVTFSPELREVMRSSSHLVLEVEAPQVGGHASPVQVGDVISFQPGYFATVAAMSSPFIRKEFVE